MSGCRLVRRQLSLILPEAVYEEWQETPNDLVTDQRDGLSLSIVGPEAEGVSEPHWAPLSRWGKGIL